MKILYVVMFSNFDDHFGNGTTKFVGVFSSKEKAKAYINSLPGAGCKCTIKT